MRVIYLLNFVTLVVARPDAGYNYRPPQPIPPAQQYGAPGIGTTGVGTNFVGGVTGNIGTNFVGTSNIGITGTGGISTGGISTGGISTGGITTGGVGNIHRHVYVYTAPQEEEIIQQRQIATAQAQKHYKIIFIKAPSFPVYSQAAIQAQAQNQEKTIIYVLAKRPEEAGDINLPTVAPTQPSKPEVYFIRYKTQNTAVGGATGVADGGTNVGISTGTGTGISTGTGTGISTGGISSQYGVPGQSGPY